MAKNGQISARNAKKPRKTLGLTTIADQKCEIKVEEIQNEVNENQVENENDSSWSPSK